MTLTNLVITLAAPAAVEPVAGSAWQLLLAWITMVGVAVIPFPAELPAMANALWFGPVVGVLITWSGAMTGAAISYELARKYGTNVVARFVPRYRLSTTRQRLERSSGAVALLALRLLPMVAFTALNWMAGLLPVPRLTFYWTTAIGIIPGAIAFTLAAPWALRIAKMTPFGTALLLLLIIAYVCWKRPLRHGREGVGTPEAGEPGEGEKR